MTERATSTTVLSVPDHTPETLTQWLADRDEHWAKPFRAKQLLNHYYHALTPDVAGMTDLPQGLRDIMPAELPLDPLEVVERQDDGYGSTKLAVRPHDFADRADRSGVIELVIMRDSSRDSRTICISNQIGCAMGCRFCASGLGGLVRNLTPGEIISQVWHAARILHDEGHGSGGHDGRLGRRARESAKELDGSPVITNIVFMGVGEPLANLRGTVAALHALTADWGFGLSPRRITVSTVGLVPGIHRLAEEKFGINLAISLHAADDATRERIMPARPGRPPGATGDVAPGTVARLMDAADHYFEATGREVTIEFILLPGVNDHQADALADLIAAHPRGRYNVNVIPYNAVAEFEWREPTGDETHAFLDALRARGVNAHARKRMGYGIDGACGQLRLNRG